MEHSMATTAFELDGFKAARTLGMVRGITVRSRSVFGNMGAGIQTIFGGKITFYEKLCEQTREESFDAMLAHADVMGANGVIGVRYDTTEVMSGVTEVLCYGTAVVVEPA
ncbi:MAG: YbjQ family protein [Actinobacteria bacterium]|nr:YbjQ family protein [Actinomycetota bacterium]MCL5882429.1 YbjQ family protein [Actinomycetota bacterium]